MKQKLLIISTTLSLLLSCNLMERDLENPSSDSSSSTAISEDDFDAELTENDLEDLTESAISEDSVLKQMEAEDEELVAASEILSDELEVAEVDTSGVLSTSSEIPYNVVSDAFTESSPMFYRPTPFLGPWIVTLKWGRVPVPMGSIFYSINEFDGTKTDFSLNVSLSGGADDKIVFIKEILFEDEQDIEDSVSITSTNLDVTSDIGPKYDGVRFAIFADEDNHPTLSINTDNTDLYGETVDLYGLNHFNRFYRIKDENPNKNAVSVNIRRVIHDCPSGVLKAISEKDQNGKYVIKGIMRDLYLKGNLRFIARIIPGSTNCKRVDIFSGKVVNEFGEVVALIRGKVDKAEELVRAKLLRKIGRNGKAKFVESGRIEADLFLTTDEDGNETGDFELMGDWKLFCGECRDKNKKAPGGRMDEDVASLLEEITSSENSVTSIE